MNADRGPSLDRAGEERCNDPEPPDEDYRRTCRWSDSTRAHMYYDCPPLLRFKLTQRHSLPENKKPGVGPTLDARNRRTHARALTDVGMCLAKAWVQ